MLDSRWRQIKLTHFSVQAGFFAVLLIYRTKKPDFSAYLRLHDARRASARLRESQICKKNRLEIRLASQTGANGQLTYSVSSPVKLPSPWR